MVHPRGEVNKEQVELEYGSFSEPQMNPEEMRKLLKNAVNMRSKHKEEYLTEDVTKKVVERKSKGIEGQENNKEKIRRHGGNDIGLCLLEANWIFLTIVYSRSHV